MDKIKLLIVNDSFMLSKVISHYITNDERIEVIGKTDDTRTTNELILKYKPDVMILNIEMLKFDGVLFLKKLLPQYYIPAIVFSYSNKKKQNYIKAGAAEFLTIPKNSSDRDIEIFVSELCATVRRVCEKKFGVVDLTKPPFPEKIPTSYERISTISEKEEISAEEEIQEKPVKKFYSFTNKINIEKNTNSIANNNINSSTTFANNETPLRNRAKLRKSDAVIALGASTGGTDALIKVVKEFPEDTSPVLIVQHMPAGFTKMYAERLNKICKMNAKEAEDGDRLRRGLIILGAGDYHMRLCKDSRGYYISSKKGERVSGHCPSVDVMFSSVAETAGADAIGAIFTGMGRDGADGLLKMRNAGAFTIGQDKETCVVYGMPMEAYNIGAVEVQAPLDKIASIILSYLY